MEAFDKDREEVNQVSVGPRLAMRTMKETLVDRETTKIWKEKARAQAILGSCSRSIESVKSGARCYMAFVGEHDIS